jgi:hypothetical protein
LSSEEEQEQAEARQYDAWDWEPGGYDPNDPAYRAFDEDLAKFGDTVQLAPSDVARLEAAAQAADEQTRDEQAADEEAEDPETLLEEPAASPSPVAAPRRPLNRKERRRREKLQRRMKRKAK